ncbi:4Fe-4S binding protein [Thermofilum pendens]|uniref:4Fe-4S ferredoxin, iron-sulfur binding domain protein n=1 Tax=Thermofilum pendens (strain DSM 2475 / Hrk 5) TaxID=368408 RepID=A1RZ41_THEPD|nr:4Fe-4S binding protein [Thermofilum pendens]ABL78471.1 4Fe-4S ferredoxin, iron-sulfur binding domain protein [Thermofilum pendens Hrk 5]
MNKYRSKLEILKTAVKSLLQPPLTVPYTGHLNNSFIRGAPLLDRDKCLGCSLCARSCPSGAITMVPGGKKVVGGKEVERKIPSFNYYQCIYCGVCAEVCPGRAISMVKKQPVEIISLASLLPLATGEPEALKVLFSFLLLLVAVSFAYWLSGRVAARGKHTEKAREPFTGGVAPRLPTYRYHVEELYTFVILFVMLEITAFTMILERDASVILPCLLFLAYLLLLASPATRGR